MHLRDARQSRQILAMNAGKIVGIPRQYFQQIIRRPRHQVAFQHIRHPPHLTLELLQHLIGLPRKGDLDKDRGRPIQPARIQQRHISVDKPLVL